MRPASAVELAAGVATPVVLAAGIASAVFAPGGRSTATSSTLTSGGVVTSSTTVTRSASVWDTGLPPTAALLLGVALACAAAVGVGAMAHARHGTPRALSLMAGGTALLRCTVVLFGFSLGFALVPGWLCALVALLAALAAERSTPSTSRRSPSRGGAANGTALGALTGLGVEWAALSTLPILGIAGMGGNAAGAYAFFGAALASPVCAALGGIVGAIHEARRSA